MELLMGPATATAEGYTSATSGGNKNIKCGIIEALLTGKVEAIRLRTNATANTGVTSVVLGIYADNGSGTEPTGAALAEATFTGEPGVSAWIEVTGLSLSVTAGTKYWLAVLSIGGTAHFNQAKASGGTRICKTTVNTFTTLTSASWTTFNETGPLAVQALGTTGALMPLNAASSSSSATAELSAPTQVPLAAGASVSSAQGEVSVSSGQRIPLNAGSSVSAASAAVSAKTLVPLNAALSEVGASTQMELSAPTQVPLNAASSVSVASATVHTGSSPASPDAKLLEMMV